MVLYLCITLRQAFRKRGDLQKEESPLPDLQMEDFALLKRTRGHQRDRGQWRFNHKAESSPFQVAGASFSLENKGGKKAGTPFTALSMVVQKRVSLVELRVLFTTAAPCWGRCYLHLLLVLLLVPCEQGVASKSAAQWFGSRFQHVPLGWLN